ARHVDRLGLAGEVVEREADQSRRRSTQEAVNSGDQAAIADVRVRRRQTPIGGEEREELTALAIARRLDVGQLGVAHEAQLAAQLDVAAGPEAGEGRHVVRVDRGERQRRIVRGALEPAPVAFEAEHLGRENAPLLERAGDFRRNGAEVFADDEGAVALTLEGEDAEEVDGGIPNVRAGYAGTVIRNPEQAEQPEYVVDAQRAGMLEGAAQQVDEVAIAVAPQGARVERWKAPVLPAHGERIGRRADAGAVHEQLGKGPRVGAARRRADRQILI